MSILISEFDEANQATIDTKLADSIAASQQISGKQAGGAEIRSSSQAMSMHISSKELGLSTMQGPMHVQMEEAVQSWPIPARSPKNPRVKEVKRIGDIAVSHSQPDLGFNGESMPKLYGESMPRFNGQRDQPQPFPPDGTGQVMSIDGGQEGYWRGGAEEWLHQEPPSIHPGQGGGIIACVNQVVPGGDTNAGVNQAVTT